MYKNSFRKSTFFIVLLVLTVTFFGCFSSFAETVTDEGDQGSAIYTDTQADMQAEGDDIASPDDSSANPGTDEGDDPAGDQDQDVIAPPAEYTITYVDGSQQNTETVLEGESPSDIPEAANKDLPFLGWKDEAGNIVDPASIVVDRDMVLTARYGVLLNSVDHNKYMNGNNKGCFLPEGNLTRAEAAQMLYNLIDTKEEPTKTFSDVAPGEWYAVPVSTLATMDLIAGYGDGSFAPGKNISRAEFVAMLSRFSDLASGDSTFVDVPAGHWAWAQIVSAAEKGWVGGYPDGTFKPDKPVTRAEVAVMMNRILGRGGDKEMIKSSPDTRIFIDLSSDHWAYFDIMEATIAHTYHDDEAGVEAWDTMTDEGTVLSPGLYNATGYLYCVGSDGKFVKGQTVGGRTFDSEGRYTTGNKELDGYIYNAISPRINANMTMDEKLRATFNYVRDSFVYLKRDLISAGTTGWEEGYALSMFQMGKGNCYSFAATYYEIVRALGCDANTVVGVVGYRRSPHGWVEIRLGGSTYMFDTELEMAYRERGNYNYDLFKMTPGRTPFIYEAL